MRAAPSMARPPISPRATSPASWLASTGVIGTSLKLISARFGSIFAAGERSFVAPVALPNRTTAVGGRGCSRSFTSANRGPSQYKIFLRAVFASNVGASRLPSTTLRLENKQVWNRRMALLVLEVVKLLAIQPETVRLIWLKL